MAITRAVVGKRINAAQYNEIPDAIEKFCAVSLVKSGTQAISASTTTVVTFGSTSTSITKGSITLNAATGRVTIVNAGVYRVSATAPFDAATSGSRALLIQKNGSVVARVVVSTATVESLTAATIVECGVGDYLELAVISTTAVTLGLSSGSYYPSFAIDYIGPS